MSHHNTRKDSPSPASGGTYPTAQTGNSKSPPSSGSGGGLLVRMLAQRNTLKPRWTDAEMAALWTACAEYPRARHGGNDRRWRTIAAQPGLENRTASACYQQAYSKGRHR